MSVKVEEKSLQLALVKAAGQLGTTQDAVAYRVIHKYDGFLGFFGKKVAIEAWEKPRKVGQKRPYGRGRGASRSPQDGPEARVLSERETGELKDSLRGFCVGICEKMLGRQVEVKAQIDQDRLILDICDADLAQIMGKNVRFAEAFEHILRKKPRHIRQELPFRIFVDVNGIRRTREAELMTMARDLSNKVYENKRPIVLNYRSSYDRKIIHMALDKDDRVYTRSIGAGPNRKLMILPGRDEVAQTS